MPVNYNQHRKAICVNNSNIKVPKLKQNYKNKTFLNKVNIKTCYIILLLFIGILFVGLATYSYLKGYSNIYGNDMIFRVYKCNDILVPIWDISHEQISSMGNMCCRCNGLDINMIAISRYKSNINFLFSLSQIILL